MPDNPFVVSNYYGPKWFCDREAETLQLAKLLKNQNNITLFAIRRLGKTGLVQHLFHHLSATTKMACIYVDIFSTDSLKSFTNQLATAVYSRFPERKGIGEKFFSFIKLLRPVFSFDEYNGSPQVSFEFATPKEYEKSIQQILTFLDNQKIKVVVAIDEFQQITSYPEKNTEAILRTIMQNLKNCRFIFCGSNHRLMHDIFNSAKRPFYASCTNVNLGFIKRADYAAFITGHFKQAKRNMTLEAVDYLLDFTEGFTYYTQVMCNRLYATAIKKIDIETVKKECGDLLSLNEPIFFQYRNLLTTAQWQLLIAIAKETRLYKPHSSEFIKKYRLGTSSLVTRGLDALLTKEMIYHHTTEQKPHYAVYDKFLMRWLQNQF